MADSLEVPGYDAELSNSDAESKFASEMEMADSIELPDYIEESEFPNEMEITVQSDAIHNYVLLAYDDNIVEDVLVKILGSERAGRAPEPRLFFNDLELEKQKTLAEYGIKLNSVLHLRCLPRVLVQADNATEIAEMDCAEPRSSMRPNGADEMKIFVRSKYFGNYELEVDSSNTIRDVLDTVLPIWAVSMTPKPKLYFNGNLLKEKFKSLSDYSIQDGSILHLKCPYWMSISANDHTTERPLGSGKLKIFVRSLYRDSYAFEVDSSNTIQDVLDTIDLYFGVRTNEDYGIEDGSILHLNLKGVGFRPYSRPCSVTDEYDAFRPYSRPCSVTDERQWRRRIPARDMIMITDQPLAIWEKEHDKVLLSLLVEQISNGGRKILLRLGKDSWCNIVTKFNELTGLKYEYKHLYNRFEFYEREYQIVNLIRHHPTFSWDHQRQVVIATDAEWEDYIATCHEAGPYRRRAIPYIDLLETIFADKEEPEITL